jgi:hypothetical protein
MEGAILVVLLLAVTVLVVYSGPGRWAHATARGKASGETRSTPCLRRDGHRRRRLLASAGCSSRPLPRHRRRVPCALTPVVHPPPPD